MLKACRWSALFAGCLALSACDAGSSSGDGSSGGNVQPDPSSPDTPPWWSLPAGSRYFVRGGAAVPLLLRNVSASSAEAFTPLFQQAHAAGARAVRLQLTQGLGYGTLGITSQGGVIPAFADAWDSVLDQASSAELAVIPVFGIWGDWNDGTPSLGWTHFDANPLNSVNGGPATSPTDLLRDSAAQRAWLGWLGNLVQRFSRHPNVIAWEVFSELDLVTGADEDSATAFAEIASDTIRSHDSQARPVLASTSDLPLIDGAPWLKLWQSRGNDLVSLHTYDQALDRTLLDRVRQVRSFTDKPVFIGESGLDAAAPDGSTLTSAPRANIATSDAVWLALVSGAADARALYWEDGYAAFYPETGLSFVQSMNGLETPAASWLANADFTDLEPTNITVTSPLFGAALAKPTLVRGWLRDGSTEPPDWPQTSSVKAQVQVTLPAGTPDGAWRVLLSDPNGNDLPEVEGQAQAGALNFELTLSTSSFAFRAHP